MDLFLRVSATNCACLYDIAQARRPLPHDLDWQFGTTLTTEQVWDAFTILALLEDAQGRHTWLVVPYDGMQQNCFTATMCARTEHRIIVFGWQDELPHACDGCVCIFKTADGRTLCTEVVVTDGVTIGHPCCAIPYCKNPLASNRHRFCSAEPTHPSVNPLFSHSPDSHYSIVTASYSMTAQQCHRLTTGSSSTVHYSMY